MIGLNAGVEDRDIDIDPPVDSVDPRRRAVEATGPANAARDALRRLWGLIPLLARVTPLGGGARGRPEVPRSRLNCRLVGAEAPVLVHRRRDPSHSAPPCDRSGPFRGPLSCGDPTA